MKKMEADEGYQERVHQATTDALLVKGSVQDMVVEPL